MRLVAANQKEATPKLKILGNFGNKTFSYENTALVGFIVIYQLYKSGSNGIWEY